MDRIEKVDKVINDIIELLPCIYDNYDCSGKSSRFVTNPDKSEILSKSRTEIEVLADLFDQLYDEGTITTGYYDPVEDERNGEVDIYTGWHYLSIGE